MLTRLSFEKVRSKRVRVWRVRHERGGKWRVEYFGPGSLVTAENCYGGHIELGRRCLMDKVRAREVGEDMTTVWTCSEPSESEVRMAMDLLAVLGYPRKVTEERFRGVSQSNDDSC